MRHFDLTQIWGSIFLFLTISSGAHALDGVVVKVADGDTISLVDPAKISHKVRLASIDAPEKGQAFGQRSRESLSNLLFHKNVTVETTKKDRYGREVGKVMVDGLDVNLEQLRRGMAWHYKAYEREQPTKERQEYTDAEIEARTAKRGLWGDLAPTPPWEYRHSKN